MRKLILALTFVLTVLPSAIAQNPASPVPETPTECVTAIQNYPRQRAEAARKAGEKLNYRQYQTEARELAQKYAAKFNVESVRENELIALARLYVGAQQYDQAHAAIKRRLALTHLTTEERAETLSAAVDVVMAVKDVTDETLRQAESYVAQLDALPGAPIRHKIGAHGRIAGYYSYADMDAKNLEHHQKIIELINKLPAEERKQFANRKAGAYESLALVYGNRGQAEKSLEILKNGQADLADVPNSSRWFSQAISRYSMIGQPGAPIKAVHWINTDIAAKELNFGGRVTLLQFTAHWCVPCRNSYPAILELHEKFANRSFEVVFSTQLYGYFEKRNDLKPEEEIAANQEYYAKHHRLPFRIAIEERRTYPESGPPPVRDDNEAKYFVGGIPQMVLLDKQGKVRLVMIGWDQANEARMTELIEKLLKEPEPAAKP